MKKYFKKFHASSSTAKLFFFILLLLGIVFLASSGFYIQYKNRKKPIVAESVTSIQSSNETKQTANPVASSSGNDSAATGAATANSSVAAAPQTVAPAPPRTPAACTKQILRGRVVHKEAAWLSRGEKRVTPGQDGFTESCPGKKQVTQNPIDQIVYTGTKPLSEVRSLLHSVTNGLMNL